MYIERRGQFALLFSSPWWCVRNCCLSYKRKGERESRTTVVSPVENHVNFICCVTSRSGRNGRPFFDTDRPGVCADFWALERKDWFVDGLSERHMPYFFGKTAKENEATDILAEVA